MRAYECRWNFPHCVGALDGKHILVQKPKKSGSLFFNYKHFHSITLLALVDANYRFLYVDVGGEGLMSDGGLWQHSKLRKRIEKDRLGIPSADNLPQPETKFPYMIVGDDAFPLDMHLMKPFHRRDLTHSQRIFNYRLSQARRCSENVFGILASRFCLFQRDIDAQPQNAIKIVLAGVCLHNFIREKCVNMYIPPGAVDSEDANNRIVPGEWRQVVH